MSDANRVVIGLDVGGTSVKAGLVAESGSLLWGPRTLEVASDRDAATILSRFEEILRILWTEAGDRRVVGIGVGMPGPFDYANGVSLIRGLNKYDAIYGINLREEWQRRLDLPDSFPLRFINDAAAFALGESLYGAGRGRQRVMAITLGTGCGGSFVVDGRVVTEGEDVPEGGEVYHLPFRGEIIDEWISRRGILRMWAGMAPERSGMDVKEIAEAARSCDSQALALMAQFGTALADALGPVAEAFRPDLLVVGGRIARSMDLFGAPLREWLAAIGSDLAVSQDGAAGVRGAAGLIWTDGGDRDID